MKPRVLIVDDEDTIRNLLKSRIEREGYETAVAATSDEAQRKFLTGGEVGVLVTDLKMPEKDGFSLMAWAKEKNPKVRVIMITGHGDKDVAVKALRSGASDYLEKPFDLDELCHAINRSTREYVLERENADLVSRLEERVQRVEGKPEDRGWYTSKATSMHKANEWLTILRRESMRGDAEEPAVLILGESGTGKEGIARMIHSGSRRARGPWVAVNCANFSEQLLESELFGHERGAFTGANAAKRGLFELAKGGTLFLDEIGEMDTKLQVKLLRVLQEKVFRRVGGTADLQADVRVVAATNRDLQNRVAKGEFRDDLFHRINRVVIELPSLRNRREDILPMAIQFAERAFKNRGKEYAGFTEEAEEALRSYDWPGNVRELLNVVERTALIWEGTGPVTLRALAIPAPRVAARPKFEVVGDGFVPAVGPAPDGIVTPPEGYTELKRRWSDSFEKEYLLATLKRHSGNVSAAAREARLDRSNFLRLLRRHGLKATEFRKLAA